MMRTQHCRPRPTGFGWLILLGLFLWCMLPGDNKASAQQPRATPTPVTPRATPRVMLAEGDDAAVVGVKAVINGATTKEAARITVKAGDRLTLDGSQSTGSGIKFRWRAPDYGPAYAGRQGIEVTADGRGCHVPTWADTQFVYRLIVWNADDVHDIEFLVIVEPCSPGNPTPSPVPTPVQPVPGPLPPAPTPAPGPLQPVPQPGPQPIPQPPAPVPMPQPVPPAGRFGLAGQVTAWAQQVNSPTRVAEAQAIATSLLSLASALEGGKYAELSGFALASAIQGDIGALTTIAAGANLQEWKDKLGKPFGVAVIRLVATGQVKTPKDWNDLAREAAAGLQAVRS